MSNNITQLNPRADEIQDRLGARILPQKQPSLDRLLAHQQDSKLYTPTIVREARNKARAFLRDLPYADMIGLGRSAYDHPAQTGTDYQPLVRAMRDVNWLDTLDLHKQTQTKPLDLMALIISHAKLTPTEQIRDRQQAFSISAPCTLFDGCQFVGFTDRLHLDAEHATFSANPNDKLSWSEFSHSKIGGNLAHATFSRSTIHHCSIEDAQLNDVRFLHCSIADSTLSHTTMACAEMLGCEVNNTRFSHCDLQSSHIAKGCQFTNTHFINCDFSGVEIDGAQFTHCTFKDCSGLDSVNLVSETHFKNCEFTRNGMVDQAVINGFTYQGARFENTLTPDAPATPPAVAKPSKQIVAAKDVVTCVIQGDGERSPRRTGHLRSVQ